MEKKILFANAAKIAINNNGTEVFVSFQTTGPSFDDAPDGRIEDNVVLEETSILMNTDTASGLVTALGQLVFGDKFVVSEEATSGNE